MVYISDKWHLRRIFSESICRVFNNIIEWRVLALPTTVKAWDRFYNRRPVQDCAGIQRTASDGMTGKAGSVTGSTSIFLDRTGASDGVIIFPSEASPPSLAHPTRGWNVHYNNITRSRQRSRWYYGRSNIHLRLRTLAARRGRNRPILCYCSCTDNTVRYVHNTTIYLRQVSACAPQSCA